MSSETTAELADLVNEWLRIDQVRMDNSTKRSTVIFRH